MKKIIFILAVLLLFTSHTFATAIVLTETEELEICRAVHGECTDLPYLAKIAMTAMILNRLEDCGFPSTVHDIIYDTGAFPNLERASQLELDDLKEEKLALDAVVLDGIDPTCGAVFFMLDDDVELWKIHQSFKVENMVFGKPKIILK